MKNLVEYINEAKAEFKDKIATAILFIVTFSPLGGRDTSLMQSQPRIPLTALSSWVWEVGGQNILARLLPSHLYECPQGFSANGSGSSTLAFCW